MSPSEGTGIELASAARAVLVDGETLQAVFTARSGVSPGRWLASFFRARRIVVVTDTAIRVFAASVTSATRPAGEISTVERDTPMVPHREERWSSIELGGETLWVNNHSLSQICHANNLRTRTSLLPDAL